MDVTLLKSLLSQWQQKDNPDISDADWVRFTSAVLKPHLPGRANSARVAPFLLDCRTTLPSDNILNTWIASWTPPEPIQAQAFRGETGNNPSNSSFHSRLPVISFGEYEVAHTYALESNNNDTVEAPKIFKAELQINTPFYNDEDDPFIDVGYLLVCLGHETTAKFLRDNVEHLTNTDNWSEQKEALGIEDLTCEAALEVFLQDFDKLNLLYIDAYPVFDNQELVSKITALGYDGMVHSGNGESAMTAEYKITHQDQAKVLNVEELRPNAPRVDTPIRRAGISASP